MTVTKPCPYETLKVRKDASKEAITKSFRRLVKKAHPDTGGSPERFKELHFAYKLLTDDVRRSRYDATGEMDEPQIDKTLAETVGVLSAVFAGVMQQIVSQGRDPKSENLAELMRKMLLDGKEEGKKHQRQLQKAKDALTSIPERFTVDDGDNFLKNIAEHQIRQTEMQLKSVETELAKIDRAMELLKKFKFRHDARKSIQSFSATSATASVWINLG